MLYDDFLKLTGMKPSQEAVEEYYRANIAYSCCNYDDEEVFCQVWLLDYRHSHIVRGLIEEIKLLRTQIAQKSELLDMLSLDAPHKIALLKELKDVLDRYLTEPKKQ